MKKTIQTVALAVALTFGGAVTAVGTTAEAAQSAVAASKDNKSDKKPQIRFAEKQHDFGIVKEKGGPISYSFEFTNTGDAPLVILSATASCGCTRPTYPTEPIAPGKKGKIKVTYLPDGRPGEFNKVVKVRTNAKDSKKISLIIKGTVRP